MDVERVGLRGDRERTSLAVAYSGNKDSWQVSVPVETVADLLRPFEGRKRAFLVSLLNGKSKTMAAASIGVTPRCTQQWAAKDSTFAEAVELAERIGFAGVVESELYRRALAGPDDRGSMRALELVVKSRDASYREKQQVQMDIIVQARESQARLVAGWEQEPDE